jgi:hypothetical protein
MNPRELVNHIRSGPAELVLDEYEALRFRRRTRSNPCDFNDFLQALQSSETIRSVECESHLRLDISEDEWVLLLKTLGRIRDIRRLEFCCERGSRYFHHFQAVAEAVNNARSLRNLKVTIRGETFPRDQSGLTALANALREHKKLYGFCWFDFVSRLQTAPVDPVLQALPACSHLQRVEIVTNCASDGAMRNLLQLPKDTRLSLLHTNKEHWLAVADGIRQGQCNIKTLHLALEPQNRSPRATEVEKATEAVKAIASAIRLDHNLEHLTLRIQEDITDEAGVVLAEALTVNTTLRKLTMYLHSSWQLHDGAMLSAPFYEAFCAMLRVNTYLVLKLPPFNDTFGDERLVDSRNRMHIEQVLNKVGRGRLLSSSQTPRGDWVDALNELNSSNVDESPELNVSCLYSLLRLNPSICLL